MTWNGWAGACVAGALLWGLAASGLAVAETAGGDQAENQRLESILRAQHPQFGDVPVPTAGATLHLGKQYYFLTADEAKQVLKEWGNPPEMTEGVLGMVFPAGRTFLDDGGWGGVITYEPAGYISDKDADKTDYAKYVDEVRKGEDAENERRKKAGFSSTHLVGWAQPPSYDKARHYMIWARDVRFGDDPEDSLNYDVRVLGRRGYLSVNVVSKMSALPQIRKDAAQLAAVTSFDPGGAYTDYQPSSDKTAGYGVAGLVAAGLGLAAAKKFGLLALLAVFGKKIAIVVAAAFAAVVSRFKKLFKKTPSTPA
jgi:uncharacterized membrane-anchored protein